MKPARVHLSREFVDLLMQIYPSAENPTKALTEHLSKTLIISEALDAQRNNNGTTRKHK